MQLRFHITLVMLILVLVATSCTGGTYVSVQEDGMNHIDEYVEEWIVIDYEFVQDTKYDMMSMVYRSFKADEWNGELYLYFDEVRAQQTLDFDAEKARFESPRDFDFENHVMLITYGRELVSLEVISGQYNGLAFYYCVTYGMEYFEDKAFFYSIVRDDSMRIVPPALGFHSYLLQEDGERVEFFTADIDPETWNGPYNR